MTKYRLLHIPTLRKYWKAFESKDNKVFIGYSKLLYDIDDSVYFTLGYNHNIWHWDVSSDINKEEFMWIEEDG